MYSTDRLDSNVSNQSREFDESLKIKKNTLERFKTMSSNQFECRGSTNFEINEEYLRDGSADPNYEVRENVTLLSGTGLSSNMGEFCRKNGRLEHVAESGVPG
jgi:hypothetical protein